MECPNCEMTDRQFENSTFDLTFNDRDTGQDITFNAYLLDYEDYH